MNDIDEIRKALDALANVVRATAVLVLVPNVDWPVKARHLQHALDALDEILPRQNQLVTDLQAMIDGLDD